MTDEVTRPDAIPAEDLPYLDGLGILAERYHWTREGLLRASMDSDTRSNMREELDEGLADFIGNHLASLLADQRRRVLDQSLNIVGRAVFRAGIWSLTDEMNIAIRAALKTAEIIEQNSMAAPIEPAQLTVSPLAPEYAGQDPRETTTVFGKRIEIGEPIPTDVAYPGWHLTPFTFPDDPGQDGCFFELESNTFTPVGVVGEPDLNNEQVPAFTEYITNGSGTLLAQTPDGTLHVIPVSADKPVVYKYGVGTKIAYIAGPDGLVGVNVGKPVGIPEDSLPNDDPQASAKLWDKYRELTSGLQTT